MSQPWTQVDRQYKQTTGWVTDFFDPEGDGEQVDYCLTLDGSDVLIGQKRIEDGFMVSDRWLVSMKAETFEKLVELWQEKVKE